MAVPRLTALAAAMAMASACGNAAPTAPHVVSGGTGLTVTCNTPTILAGEIVVCIAVAASANVTTEASWTSSDPNIAPYQGIGVFLGKTEGQVTLTATYAGQTASAHLIVHLQDVLRATAAAYQGTFQVGTTATLWLQGYYGVASADSGILTLVVTDQTGATIATSTPLVVPRGGDRYLISTTFTLPAGTTGICRTGVLQIGSSTLTVIPDAVLVPCFAVTP